jgi:predicted transcriptional regulator
MLKNVFMKIEDLKELGFDEKQMKILFVLKDGPLSGPEIEKATELRQPEVSRALKELRTKGFVKLERREKRFKHGAPCKIWELSRPFNEIIRDIVGRKLTELDRKLRICVEILFELGDSIDEETLKAIRELAEKDVVVVELNPCPKNGDEGVRL